MGRGFTPRSTSNWAALANRRLGLLAAGPTPACSAQPQASDLTIRAPGMLDCMPAQPMGLTPAQGQGRQVAR